MSLSLMDIMKQIINPSCIYILHGLNMMKVVIIYLYWIESIELANQLIPFVRNLTLDYTCGEELIVSKEEDCSKLFMNTWSSILIKNGLCNSLYEDLVISNYTCLHSIHIEDNSLQNIHTLEINNNPNLQFILFGYSTIYYSTSVIISGSFKIAIILLELPSLKELRFVIDALCFVESLIIHGQLNILSLRI